MNDRHPNEERLWAFLSGAMWGMAFMAAVWLVATLA